MSRMRIFGPNARQILVTSVLAASIAFSCSKPRPERLVEPVFPPTSEEIVSSFAKDLRSSNDRDRSDAGSNLARMAVNGDRAAVSELMKALSGNSLDARMEAVRAFRSIAMGKVDIPLAIPALEGMLSEKYIFTGSKSYNFPDEARRTLVAAAVLRSVPALAKELEQGPSARETAVEALNERARSGDDINVAVPGLVKCLCDEVSTMGRSATNALRHEISRVGREKGAENQAALTKYISSKVGPCGLDSAIMIYISEGGIDGLDDVSMIFKSDGQDGKSVAAEVFPMLSRQLAYSQHYTMHVADALRGIAMGGGDISPMLHNLAEMLLDRDALVRFSAANALEAAACPKESRKAALAILKKARRDGDRITRQEAAGTLKHYEMDTRWICPE